MMMSMAVVGLFWKLLYDPSWGPINYALGLGKFDWLSNPDRALYAVAITDIWMWAPFVMLLSLAGLSAVPQHLYEAAAIDRAERLVHLHPHHPAAGGADPADRDHLPHHGGVQDLRPRLHHDRASRRTETIAIRLYKMAFQEWQTGRSSALAYIVLIVVRGDHQHLREVPQPGEGALRWRRSPRPAQRVRNRLAIAAVLVVDADLPRADLLDRLDRLQAARRRDLGAADGVLRSPRSRLRQALHQAGAAARAGRPRGLRRGALVGAAHLRRRRAGAAGQGRACSSRSIRAGSSTA